MNHVQKRYESGQKQQILFSNLNNRNLSNNSHKVGQSAGGQLSINLNKIKESHKGENPYSSNDRASKDGSQIRAIPN